MNRLKRNYHWIIALIMFFEMILYGGYLNTISIFTIPISESLGISRSSYAMSQLLRNCTSFFSTLLVASICQKFGFRKIGILCLVLGAATIVAVGLSHCYALTSVAYCLFGLTMGFLGTTGAVRIVKDWFHKRQGTVLGVITMATGFGGSILTKILTGITTRYSWRHAHFFVAGFFIILALLFLFLRNRPEDIGLQPYGFGTEPKKKKTADPAHTEWAGHSFRELVRLPHFYLMILCIFLSCLCTYLSFCVIVPHFQDRGYSVDEATNFHSVLLLALSFAKLFGGWLSDRIGIKKVALLIMAIAALGQWLLASPQNSATGYVGVILLAIGLIVTTIIPPLLTMPLFGYRAFGTITGIFMAMISLGGMLASPLANLTYDYLGSYTPAFRAAAIMDVVLIGLFLLLFFLCDRDKIKQLAAEAA